MQSIEPIICRIEEGTVQEDIVYHLDASQSHLTIHAAPRSKATVTIWLECPSPLPLPVRQAGSPARGEGMMHETEVIVEEEARLTVLCINAVDSPCSITIKQQSSVAAGASMQWQQVTLGGRDVAHDLLSRVSGANAESAVDWMFYAKGDEKQTLTVRNVFDATNGGGEILMQGVAEGTAHISAKGLIDIGLKGGGTNTYLTQRVLMLDPSAKVHAVPGLEIKTNDVKASHSATVARVTPEDLFYLASRGIPLHEARAMFVQGFLGDITQRIANEEVRAKVVGMIQKKYECVSFRA